MEIINASFTAKVQITDEEALRDFVSEGPTAPLIVVALSACINPSGNPRDYGFSLTRVSCIPVDETSEGQFEIAVTARITNVDAFREEAEARYAICWCNEPSFSGLNEMLFEILLGSNASPSPNEIGLKIKDCRF